MIYNEKPEGFIPDIECVSCLIEHEGKFVLLHRQDHKIHGNTWGQPAGKVDKKDKNLKSALAREIKEETGINAKEDELIFSKTFFVAHSDRNFLYHYFKLNLKEKFDIVIKQDEHKAFVWVTLEEALKMKLIPDEDHCLKYIYGIK
jgi:8-oxo-dGTP pyrophosphatase MutT (NUDIX family)